VYTILYVESIGDDLADLRAFDRQKILDEVEEQLSQQPTQETKRKKVVRGLKPPWEHAEPIWQLRIGEFRVFYDVDEAASQVTVRAIRHKPPHETTEDVL
jgi:mRNA-degrading endonuclease RelE of RelBE toxin-antitoxin system